jgi:hypothetical protein
MRYPAKGGVNPSYFKAKILQIHAVITSAINTAATGKGFRERIRTII